MLAIVMPIRQLSRPFHCGSQPADGLWPAFAADPGASIVTVTAAAISGKAHTPSAHRQFSSKQGSTKGSIVATGMISPMIRPLV
jgi:hypothetical protein